MPGTTIETGRVFSVGPGVRDWTVCLYDDRARCIRRSYGLTERGALRVMDKWSRSGDWRTCPECGCGNHGHYVATCSRAVRVSVPASQCPSVVCRGMSRHCHTAPCVASPVAGVPLCGIDENENYGVRA